MDGRKKCSFLKLIKNDRMKIVVFNIYLFDYHKLYPLCEYICIYNDKVKIPCSPYHIERGSGELGRRIHTRFMFLITIASS